jgi:protein phosphatase
MICSSKTGLVRSQNEDNFCFLGKTMPMKHQSLEGVYKAKGRCRNFPLVGIFDGMGGHTMGELASFAAATALADTTSSKRTSPWTKAELSDTLLALNAAVVNAGEQYRLTSTGSTGTLLALNEDTLLVANLGDSPAFLFRNGAMLELTERHTDEELMRSIGIVGRRPRLVQYLGVPDDDIVLKPHTQQETLQDGDVILLCTDGITDMMPIERIRKAVADGSDLRRAYTRLRDQTQKAGARDNYTILLCRIEKGNTI